MNQVEELERALLARAERLASAYREMTQRSRDTTLREAAERLRLREQREEAIARALGERAFRQQVQASELKMQSQLDRLRWNLVQDVERRLADRMRAFIQDDPTAYLTWLLRLIATAARAIERPALLICANPQDHQKLFARWDAVLAQLAPGQGATLCETPIATLAGVLVASEDGRIRVDHTFEGRQERLRARIQQVILERLLPVGLDTGNLFGG